MQRHRCRGTDTEAQMHRLKRKAWGRMGLTAVTWSIRTGQMRLLSLLYFWHSVAPFCSASFTRPSMKLALLSLITGVMAQSSCTSHKYGNTHETRVGTLALQKGI